MNRDSRRARIVLALLLVAAVTLVTLDFRGGDQSPLNALRGFAAGVVGPAEEAAAAVVRPVAGAVGTVGSLGSQDEKIDALERENTSLRRDLHASEFARSRARELDKMLKVAGTGRYRIVPAQVVALGTGQGFAWTATLDVGDQDGITRDMTVLNGDGLVGRVVQVGPSTSTVLLALDATAAVGARVAESMEIGVVSGRGRDPLELRLLDPNTRVERNNRLVTFGSQGEAPYVPGVPIGRVTGLEAPGELTRTANVQPYVDFTALDLVGVVVEPPRKDPRDSVLPPRPPTPTPTPTPGVTANPRSAGEPKPAGPDAKPSGRGRNGQRP